MTLLPLAATGKIEFAQLPAKVRVKVELLDKLLKNAIATGHGRKIALYADIARQMTAKGYRYSAGGIRALAAKYEKAGCDWRSLVHANLLKDAQGLPPAFKTWVQEQFERHGRSSRQAHQDIIHLWRTGNAIPGYPDSPRENPRTGIPAGWSYENLMRQCASTPFEKDAMRIGLGYARAKHGPKVFTSRAELWPMSHVMFDDCDHDHFNHYLGTKNQICRPSNLGSHELLSGCYFAYGVRPFLRRDDDTREEWKEADMRFLTAYVLMEFGYSPRGTEFPVERGTATLRERVIALLHDRTKEMHGEPLVRVELAGWTGKRQVVEGMFTGKGGGNPRHKAALEAFHNKFHNALAALPAQTGPSKERRPEQLHGLLKETEKLLALYEELPEYVRRKLLFPTLEFHTEFKPALAAIIDRLNRRTNHNLTDWDKCGFLTNQYRWNRNDDAWLSQEDYLALVPATRQLLSNIVATDQQALSRPRQLSPMEVFTAGRAGLINARHSKYGAGVTGMVAELLYCDKAEPRRKQGSYFVISDQEIESGEMVFETRITTLEGRQVELRDNKYMATVNPFAPDVLWVYSPDGGFLGCAPRAVEGSHADPRQHGIALAHARQRQQDQQERLCFRHQGIAQSEIKRLHNNADALAGPQSEIEAQLAADRAARAQADTEDLPFLD